MPMLSIHSAHSQEAVCLAENPSLLVLSLIEPGRSGWESRAEVCPILRVSGGGCALWGKRDMGGPSDCLPSRICQFWKRESSTAFSYLRIFASTIPNVEEEGIMGSASLYLFHTEVQPLSFSTCKLLGLIDKECHQLCECSVYCHYKVAVPISKSMNLGPS